MMSVNKVQNKRRREEGDERERGEEGEREGEGKEEEKREEGERVEPDEDILLQHCLLSLAPWYYHNHHVYIEHL